MFGELAQLPCVHKHENTYWVMVEGDPAQDKLTQRERGIQLKEYWTLPATVRLIPSPNLLPRLKPVTPRGPTAWIDAKLREGKKRQTHDRRGGAVHAAPGPRGDWRTVRLGDLKAGEWRELSALELNQLKK